MECCEHGSRTSGTINCGELLYQLRDCWLLKKGGRFLEFLFFLRSIIKLLQATVGRPGSRLWSVLRRPVIPSKTVRC